MTGARRLHLPGVLRRLPRWRTLIVLVVLAIVVVGVLAGLRRGPAAPPAAAAPKTSAADNRSLLSVVTGVDAGVFAQVADGGLKKALVPISEAPPLLGATRLPQVVFLADEGCGQCAAQRWSMVVALSRFGTVKDVRLAVSTVSDPAGPLATFSFRNLQYSSQYLDLIAIETKDPNGKPLATLSPDDQKVVDTYDAPPYVPAASRGAVPWLDVANRYVMSGSGYPTGVLKDLNWAQIAEKLSDAKDPVARAVVGNANWITAAICRVTGMNPGPVCNATAIQDLAKQLG